MPSLKKEWLYKDKVIGFGSVVQLVRMPPCHGGGRGFESRPVRLVKLKSLLNSVFGRLFRFGYNILLFYLLLTFKSELKALKGFYGKIGLLGFKIVQNDKTI